MDMGGKVSPNYKDRMVLRAFGYEPIVWPNLSENGEKRSMYIHALKNADNGDFSALVHFLTRHRA